MSTSRISRIGTAAAAAAVVALLAGCASSASGNHGSGSGSVSGLKSRSTAVGTVLVDPAGRTVYELVGDSASHPTCTAGCLAVWPPVEANGKQVVVNGHRVFTFVGDKAAGDTKGQHLTDRWGLWLALGADGNPITTSSSPSRGATSSSKAPAGGGPAF